MITEADKQRFDEQGYLLLEGIVDEAHCRAVRETICAHLGIVEAEPSSWPPSRGHGVINLFHAQAFWDVRQLPSVHGAFAELHGTDALWVGTDRVSFKVRDSAQLSVGPAEPIHWDGDPSRMTSRSLQGLVYLTDTSEEQGAFCCVPGIYRHLDDYLARHPEHASGRRPVIANESVEVVAGPAGSMVIWDRRLPHSSTHNLTNRPRWVQYIAMDPVGDESARAARVAEFNAMMPPAWALRQTVPGQEIPEPGPRPRLSALGQKLVGLTNW